MAVEKNRPGIAAAAGALAAALVTLPGLGVGTLWDNSETAYGEVAREILLRHDWTIMHLNGVPYFIQPPLYFWLAAVSAAIFGVTSFAFRFPSAVATIAIGAMTGWAVARQAGTRVGIYASVVLSTCLMQVIIGRLAIMDALLDLSVALTIFWWFRGIETGRDAYFIAGCIAAGFGVLAKGLVAPTVALMVTVPFYFWNRRTEPTKAPSWRAWLIGLIVFLLIAGSWPLMAWSQNYFEPLERSFAHYTIGRYTGVVENQTGPVWYYIPVLLLGFFPWSAFLPMAAIYGWRRLREPDTDPGMARLLRLALTWIVVPLLFFSFAQTKLPNYLALEFPAIALLTALYFEAIVVRGGTRSAVISASFVPLTIGAVAVAVSIFVENNHLSSDVSAAIPGFIGLGAAIFIGSLLTAVLIGRRASVEFAPYALAIATLVANDAVAITVLPHAEAYKPVPRLAAIIERRRQPGDAVGIQNISGGNALLFYTQPRVEALAPPNGGDPQGIDPRDFICGAPRVWVVAPTKRPTYDPSYGRHRSTVAIDGRAELFLFDGPACKG